jgi:hypothetical protein
LIWCIFNKENLPDDKWSKTLSIAVLIAVICIVSLTYGMLDSRVCSKSNQVKTSLIGYHHPNWSKYFWACHLFFISCILCNGYFCSQFSQILIRCKCVYCLQPDVAIVELKNMSGINIKTFVEMQNYIWCPWLW